MTAALKTARAADPFLYRAINRLGRTSVIALEIHVVYRRDLRAPIRPQMTCVPVEIAIASDAEIEEAARMWERETGYVRLELFRARRRRGQTCFVAKTSGRVVAFDWTAARREVDEKALVVLRPDEVWCLNGYTSVAWRGNAIHRALNQRMLEVARDAGCRMAYTQANFATYRSRKNVQRLGWTPAHVFMIVHLPWLGVRLPVPLWGPRHPIVSYVGNAPEDLETPA